MVDFQANSFVFSLAVSSLQVLETLVIDWMLYAGP